MASLFGGVVLMLSALVFAFGLFCVLHVIFFYAWRDVLVGSSGTLVFR